MFVWVLLVYFIYFFDNIIGVLYYTTKINDFNKSQVLYLEYNDLLKGKKAMHRTLQEKGNFGCEKRRRK